MYKIIAQTFIPLKLALSMSVIFERATGSLYEIPTSISDTTWSIGNNIETRVVSSLYLLKLKFFSQNAT